MRQWLLAGTAILLIGCAEATPEAVEPAAEAAADTAVETVNIAEADPEFDAKALAFMEYHDGIWDARWEWFDEDGNLLGELTGVEEYKRVDDGYTQLMISTVNEMDQTSHSLLVYNPLKKEILFFASGAKGDYWIMRQNPVTGVMVSDPHIDAQGQEMLLRFTILEKSQDAMKIQMERSTNSGQTWVVGFHQYNTRRTS